MENTEKNGGALEFTFEAPEGGGLVFEIENPKAPTEENKPNIPVPTPPLASVPERTEKKPAATAQPAPTAQTEEFGVPDSFEVNERYNTPVRENEHTRIYTTYVPTFTGISDTYRMKDDPRPRPKAPEPAVSAEEKKEPEAPKLTSTAVETEPPAYVPREAPTESADTVVVNVSEPSSEATEEDAINIFKFPEEELSASDRMNIEEENANRRALEELRARQAQRRAREEAERLAAEREAARIAALEEEERMRRSPDDYDIPDPEHTGFVGRGGVSTADADYSVPHGIPAETEKTRKLKVSEYTAAGQRDSFKDKFLDSLVAMRIRIIAMVILGVLAAFLENASIFGINMPELLGIEFRPSAIAIIDYQLIICAFLLVLPETLRSVKSLFRGTLTAELLLIASFAVLTLYTFITASSKYHMDYPIFGLVFITSAFFTLLSSYLAKKTQFESFKFISVKGEKKIIEHEETRKYARTMLALDGAVDGYKSSTAKTFRTNFVSDFFANSSKSTVNSKKTAIMIVLSAVIALAVALVEFFTAESSALYHAVRAFTFVAVFAVPSISLLSHGLTYYQASREVASENSTFVGEHTYQDIAGIDVIAFDDSEIFGEDDVNLKRFGFYGNEDNMNKCMRLISSLFASVGGPLHTIFSKTLEKRCTPATDPEIEADGVSGNVDGKRVAAGTAEYMQRHGIKIPEDNDSSYGGIGAESMKIMYGAEGGIVFAKFYIRYSFSEEFTSLLPALREEHIVPLVYTSDPNISNDLFRTLTMGADCMRVMKRGTRNTRTEKVYPRISASVVTDGDKINAIRLVLIARKYKRFVKRLARAELITMTVGTAGAAVLALLGATGIPTLALAAVQVISAIVLGVSGKKKFGVGKRE